ncbi:MAG: NFACT RNA binding domain-containing protein [Candidatus Pacearchaeota archaeon]|nr:NFACT RNA binding domain-containing protein [Candidatus Pacearchaeota archaeon]
MRFREFITDSGKKVLAGKNAEQNEEIVKEFEGKSNVILHTAAPGSPFCVIEDLKPNKKDIKKAAIFCAKKSQDWRDNKNDVLIHIFTGKDVYKKKSMKTGMFGVKKFDVIKIKKKDIENFECT